MFIQVVMNEISADETGSACDYDGHRINPSVLNFIV